MAVAYIAYLGTERIYADTEEPQTAENTATESEAEYTTEEVIVLDTAAESTPSESADENAPSEASPSDGMFVEYMDENTVILPEPERDGHAFVEWNTKADGSGDGYPAGSIYNINKDEELFAIWEAEGAEGDEAEESAPQSDGPAEKPESSGSSGGGYKTQVPDAASVLSEQIVSEPAEQTETEPEMISLDEQTGESGTAGAGTGTSGQEAAELKPETDTSGQTAELRPETDE